MDFESENVEHTPITNSYVRKRSRSQNVSKQRFNTERLQIYNKKSDFKRRIVTKQDLETYATIIREAENSTLQMCFEGCCLLPSQLVTFHNVIGAAIHKARRDFGIRPPSRKHIVTKRRQAANKSASESDLIVSIFDSLIAKGVTEYSSFTEHTDLSEKLKGSLVRLDKIAFSSFFRVMIHIMAREVLVDQLIAIDRRQIIVKLLCHRVLRQEFVEVINAKGGIPLEVGYIIIIIHCCCC